MQPVVRPTLLFSHSIFSKVIDKSWEMVGIVLGRLRVRLVKLEQKIVLSTHWLEIVYCSSGYLKGPAPYCSSGLPHFQPRTIPTLRVHLLSFSIRVFGLGHTLTSFSATPLALISALAFIFRMCNGVMRQLIQLLWYSSVCTIELSGICRCGPCVPFVSGFMCAGPFLGHLWWSISRKILKCWLWRCECRLRLDTAWFSAFRSCGLWDIFYVVISIFRVLVHVFMSSIVVPPASSYMQSYFASAVYEMYSIGHHRKVTLNYCLVSFVRCRWQLISPDLKHRSYVGFNCMNVLQLSTANSVNITHPLPILSHLRKSCFYSLLICCNVAHLLQHCFQCQYCGHFVCQILWSQIFITPSERLYCVPDWLQ